MHFPKKVKTLNKRVFFLSNNIYIFLFPGTEKNCGVD